MYSSIHLVGEGFLTCLSLRSESCLHIANDLQIHIKRDEHGCSSRRLLFGFGDRKDV